MLDKLKDGLIIAVLITLVFALCAVGRLAMVVTTTVSVSRPLIESTATQVSQLTFQAALIEKKALETSEEQRLYWKVISHQTSETLRHLDLNMFGGEDIKTKKVYSGVVSDVDAFVVHARTSVDNLTTHTDIILDETEGAVSDSRITLAALNRSINGVTALTTDPAWHGTLVNLQATSFQAAGTMAHFNNMSALSEAKLREMLKPASFTKEFLMRALGLASQARTLFVGN